MRIVILLLTVFVYACDRSEGPGAAAASGRDRSAGVAASYDRSFLLLSARADTPLAAVVDFSAVEAPTSIQRSVGAWIARAGDWRRLYGASWTGQPVREPWRLVPHGPLRLLAGEGDEIEALVHRADSNAFRLVPTAALAEWGVGDAVQLRLRQGELRLAEASLVGILLDVQTGAPVSQAGEAEVVFVTDGKGVSLVVARADSGRAPAWLYRGAEALSWDAVTLAPLASATGGWRIEEPTGDLRGELSPVGDPLAPVPPPGATDDGVRTFMVRGWIEARGERRTVFGILRDARE